MHIETDLQLIAKLAKERDDENWKFRTFLKGRDGDKVDACVHRILKEVVAQIDCTKCGNCCVDLRPTVRDEDVERLAKRLSMTQDEFRTQFVCEGEDGDREFRGTPCPFLQDKKCTVYTDRPEDCKSYPHLHKEHFLSRLMGVVSNYGECPIVFNVYEQLKDEMHWRRGRR